jgi:hypothetical protein
MTETTVPQAQWNENPTGCSNFAHVRLAIMTTTTYSTIVSAIALATTVGCGGSQKEAEAPADDPAAVDDEMMGVAESDMPDDGFEDGGTDEGMGGEEAPEDPEMAE